MTVQKNPWVKFEVWRSALLSTHALSSSIYSFMLKNQLQNRSNCVKNSDFMYKNKVQKAFTCSRILKYNSRDSNKKKANTIQHLKYILSSAASHKNSMKPQRG